MLHYASRKEKMVDSLDILRKFFCAITTDHRSLDGVYLVVDALDECEETSRKKLVEHFEQHFASRESNFQNSSFLKVLATSRPYPRIEDLLHPSCCIRLKTEDDEDNINQDIRTFISYKIGGLKTTRDILDSLMARADGMFLWASLVIEDLEAAPTDEIRDKLKSIPSGLNSLSASLVDNSLIKAFPWNIRLCGPILKLDDGGMVKLVHQSAKDYLQQHNVSSSASPIVLPSPLHSYHYFALTCLNYLAFEEFAQQSLVDDLPAMNYHNYRNLLGNDKSADHLELEDGRTEIPRRFPLLLFAAKYWSQFIHDADTGDSSERDELWKSFSVMSLCNLRLKFVCFWCHWVGSLPKIDAGVSQAYFGEAETNALIVATFFNLRDFVFRLVNNNSIGDIDFRIKDSNGLEQTALAIAVFCGYEIIARFLIESGAKINFIEPRRGDTLLQSLVGRGNINIVHLLVEKGADVNAEGGRYGNALQAAAGDGHEAIVKLLIDKGADVNAEGGY
ncbi:hypothetical protein FPQ18DRAFT_170759 [Pyronema domesticum]|nr:hypothetical protein FPQ18DRAFT_170759 [Pyronema domesticum]